MNKEIQDIIRDANPPDFIGRLPKIHPNSRPYDHPPNPPEITIFFFFFFFFLLCKYRAPIFLSKKCPFKVKHAPFSSIFKSLKCKILPLKGQKLEKRHKVGKGAPLYLNGAYILSHLGPYYSDGGTAKIRKMPSKKFGALRAHAFLSIENPP